MAIHIAYTTPTLVLNDVVIHKDTATIAEVARANTAMRVVVDPNNSNTSDNPTIQEYLNRENSLGFLVKSVANTMIVTEAP